MDPELKQLLQANIRLSQENNDILRGMKRRAQWGLAGQIAFWVLFVIAPLIFVWGYLGPLMSSLTGGSGFSASDMQNLVNQYRAQMGQ